MNTLLSSRRYHLKMLSAAVLLALLLESAWAVELPPATAVTEAPAADEVKALLESANTSIQQARYQMALEDLTRAYHISATLTDDDLRNNVLNSVANVYYSTGQLVQAERYFKELITLDEASGNRQSLAVSLFNLAHVYASQQRYLDAQENLQRSLAISRALNDASGTAFTLKALGVNAQAQLELGVAQAYLTQALQGFQAIGQQMQAGAVYRHLGDLAQDEGAFDRAVMYYEKAVPLLAQYSFDTALMRTYRGLSSAYEQLQRYDKAFSNHRAYTQLLQQQLEQQNRETTQRLQVEFETQRFATDNQRLVLLNESQQLELRHRENLLYMKYLEISMALVVILVVGFLLWRSRRLAQKMQVLATTDDLTGLLNRRAILQHGEQEWRRAKRFQRPFSCLIFDVDHFKSVNDTWGHAAGDQVIKTLSATVTSNLRQTDALGRFGGEEFLLVAAETDAGQAEILAERIRQGIEALVHLEMPGRVVTVSIGIAQLSTGTAFEELIAQADQALYEAKNGGRNQAVVYQQAALLSLAQGGLF